MLEDGEDSQKKEETLLEGFLSSQKNLLTFTDFDIVDSLKDE
jgi:hypothetical protein